MANSNKEMPKAISILKMRDGTMQSLLENISPAVLWNECVYSFYKHLPKAYYMLAHRATDIKTESHIPWHAQQAMIQHTHPLRNDSHLLLKILPLCEKLLNKTTFSLILMEKK